MSIAFDNITFTYFSDGPNTLAGFSACFTSDRITVLTGPSGCGKSTALYLAAGLFPQNAGRLEAGRVTVGGAELATLAPSERWARVGMLFQNPDLQFCMDTVRNELIFSLENACCDPSEFEEKIREALSFCEITDLAEREINTLSGGEKQRVMLACQIARDPDWLLLDEPFASLDDDTAGLIRERLVTLHKTRGTGILAVDHRLDLWADVADRFCLLEKDGVQELSEAAVRDMTGPYPTADATDNNRRRHDTMHDSSAILSIEGLSLEYRAGRNKTAILKDICVSFAAGEICAITGKSGSGKSSLFGALFGLYPYKGTVRINGVDLMQARKKAVGSIGFVTQSPQDQFIGGTVRDEIEAALRAQDEEVRTKKSEEILRRIHLWRYREISPYMLSQGQQRRLGVAALLTYPCSVLLCDEPTYAQDRDNTIAIMDALCAEVRRRGIAMIFTTHDKRLAAAYADRIWNLKGGRLCEIDQPLR